MLRAFDEFSKNYTNPQAPLDVRRAVCLLWVLLLASTLADGVDMLMSDEYKSIFWAGLISTAFAAAFPYGINRQSNAMRCMYFLSGAISVAWQLGGPSSGFFSSGPVAQAYGYLAVPVTLLALYLMGKDSSTLWFVTRERATDN